MDEEYRIALIRFTEHGKVYNYRCDDEDIVKGDYVRVEGNDSVLLIEDIKYFKEEDLPCPYFLLKEVIEKVNNQVKQEATEEDLEINHKEENSSKEELETSEYVDNDDIINFAAKEKIDEEIVINALVRTEFSYIDYHADSKYRVFNKGKISDYAFIREVELVNNSNLMHDNLILEINFSNDAFKMNTINIKQINPHESICLKLSLLNVDNTKIMKYNEMIPASVNFLLRDLDDNQILGEQEYNFMILPISQPSLSILDNKELYAKYVIPNSSKVKQVALDAYTINQRALVAYQNTNDGFKLGEIGAIYNALHNYGIVYQNPPAGGLYIQYQGGRVIGTQRVRLPEEVLTDRKGTCLDLSILLCSILEEVGYHSVLIIIDGHAFTGVFLNEDDKFKNSLVEINSSVVYNAAGSGHPTMVLINSVCFCADKNIPFKDAMISGIDQLKFYDGYFRAIDINRCHEKQYSPIPIDDKYQDLTLDISVDELDSDTDLGVESAHVLNLNRETEEKDKFTFWENKLLDLNEKNPLVNFRPGYTNFTRLISNEKIYNILEENDSFKMYSYELGDREIMLDIFTRSYIGVEELGVEGEVDKNFVFSLGYSKVIKNLIKKSNDAMSETGSPTLYLCCGGLIYTRKNNSQGIAPFLIIPIRIIKNKMTDTYTVSYDYEDRMVNQSFFEYYKLDHPDTDFSPLYQIKPEDSYLDIVATFKEYNREDIRLDENLFIICNLSFAHYIMWQDIRTRKEELKKNLVVKSILEDQNLIEEESISKDKNIDDLEDYKKFAAPLYYDSTQLRAILDCGAGKSFILDGPPGTGKSQTIVNMIVNAFFHGKTVLFVAEKKAALDVVADRLEKISLGRFCLELHSNKANKGDFFAKLRDSMELGPTKEPLDFTTKCTELEAKRTDLLTKLDKMHEKTYFMSLYESIVRNEELDKYYNFASFTDEYLKSIDDSKYKEFVEAIERYISVTDNIDDYSSNPFRLLLLEDINFNDKVKTQNDFRTLGDKLSLIIKDFNELNSVMNLKVVLNLKNIETILHITDLSLNKELYVKELNEYITNTDDTNNNYVFKHIIDINKLEEENPLINFTVDPKISCDIAIKDLNTKTNFLAKFFKFSKYKKNLKNIVSKELKVNKKNILDIYKLIQTYNAHIKYVKDNYSLLNKMTGLNVLESKDNIINIKDSYLYTRDFLNLIQSISDSNTLMKNITYFLNLYATKNPEVKMYYAFANQNYLDYKAEENKFNSFYKLDYNSINNEDDPVLALNELISYGSDIDNFNKLVTIATINKASHKLSSLGLSELISLVKKGLIDYHDLNDVLDKSLATGYIRLYFMDEDINYFVPTEYEAEIEKYKGYINDYSNLVIEEVSAKLTENLKHNSINYANSSPIGRLKKSISNNGRGVSIRDTLLNYDSIIRSYFPCFLMSPLSAAQYLAVDEEGGRKVSKFDLVIFDEASQIPTHEAIGPIARGNALIVAGDPQQMPPSQYYSAGLELEGDDIKFEDAQSLLEECMAIGLPRHRLSYHYRSKHESLIEFSNQNFYDGNLFTFPSPNASRSLVTFKYVTPSDDKKHTNLSKNEVNAILDTFKEIYTNPKTNMKSVGIIVFNLNQGEVVANALENLLQHDKELAKAVALAEDKTKQPYFVKNIETVQGDERDIIILSFNFGKSKEGNAVVRGPITHENGEKRLNVAVSRSKEKMIVLSSVKHTDFVRDEKIKSKGTLLLKKFIEYAVSSSNEMDEEDSKDKHTIATFIKKDLEKIGYDVAINVGNSEFRVDLAIKNNTKDAYQLGVLIDTKGTSDVISCRDRLYVQEAVLNGLKWKTIRIYALEYLKDKKATLQKIIEALDMPYIKERNEINPHIEKKEVEEFKYDTRPYKDSKGIRKVYYDNDSGFSRSIYNSIETIVNQEGPISLEMIKEKIKDNSNMKVFRKKAQDRLTYCIKQSNISFTEDQTGVFCWAKGENGKIDKFRPANGRDLNDIAKEEILSAMIQVKKVQGELNEEDLYRFTLQALEYSQSILSEKNKERLSYVYNWGKQIHKIN